MYVHNILQIVSNKRMYFHWHRKKLSRVQIAIKSDVVRSSIKIDFGYILQFRPEGIFSRNVLQSKPLKNLVTLTKIDYLFELLCKLLNSNNIQAGIYLSFLDFISLFLYIFNSIILNRIIYMNTHFLILYI